MIEGKKSLVIESVPLKAVAAELRSTRPFAGTDLDRLKGLDRVDRVTVPAGVVLVEPGAAAEFYWLVLHGEIRAERLEADGSRTLTPKSTSLKSSHLSISY